MRKTTVQQALLQRELKGQGVWQRFRPQIERLLDPETGSGQAYLLDGVTAVEAPDASTVTFTLEAPNPALLTKLAGSKSVGIIARESVENGTINTQPIGTGPFMITDYQPGVGLTLERNPNFWQEGLPCLDAIDVQIITDESVRRSARLRAAPAPAPALPAVPSRSRLR